MLAPWILVAAYAGTLELGDASEARVRSTTGQQAGAPTYAADVSTQPVVRGRVADRRWELTFSYLPSLTLPDLELGLNLEVLQTASVGMGWHDRLVRVAIAADVTYGTFNSAYLSAPAPPGQLTAAGTSPPPLQLAAQPAPITLLSTHPTASIGIRADRRTSLLFDAGYSISGGLDATSQRELPQQKGASADASVLYNVSRTDQLLTLLHGQETEFGFLDCSIYMRSFTNSGALCAPQGQILQASEGIGHSFTRATRLALSAGATLSWSRLQPTDPYHSVWFPSAGVTLSHHFGERGRSDLEIGVQLAPLFDAFTGLVTNRGQVTMSMLDTLSPVFALAFTASGLQTFPTTDPLAATMVAAGAELGIRLNKQVRLAAGVRAAWQSEGNLNFLSAMSYFDVTVFAPKLRY